MEKWAKDPNIQLSKEHTQKQQTHQKILNTTNHYKYKSKLK